MLSLLVQEAASSPASTSLFDTMLRGGWVMLLIALLSVAAIFLLVERFLTLRRASKDPDLTTDRIRDYVQDGDIEGALSYCDAADTPTTRVLRQGLERLGRPISEIQDAVQAAGKHEAFKLEQRTGLLATIAAIAPMLGFLGTVTGMIEAFQDVQRLQGNVNPGVLAGGIWEALLTTAAGLFVGILTLAFYNFLLGRINRLVNHMERSATNFIDLLQEPAPTRQNQYAESV